MTCPTKEDRIAQYLDSMEIGRAFYTKDVAKVCNIGTHEAGKRLPRTLKAVKISALGKPCRWMRKDISEERG
ncbi:MAG: hypothetical protein M0Q91_13340 [Methanoregula sp.]|nr:hypothetical protein [Methanoregula sp.]